ncbi:MAG: DUF1932 domain-containing protein [Clostridia bacterium]
MRVGFIGFGEAASSIAEGLYNEGIQDLLAFDVLYGNPVFADKFEEKMKVIGNKMAATSKEVAQNSDVIFAAVPANYSVAAAKDAVEGLNSVTLYADVSTATPAEKKEIAEIVESKGGKFIDGAMMGAVIKFKHKVPMLISGSGIDKFAELMSPCHMDFTKINEIPGAATSIKFIRSITAKGLACLLIESLQAAKRFGVEDIILDSLCGSLGGPEFEKIIDGFVSGTVIHAERREHELKNVTEFLKQSNLPYTMSEATMKKLGWVHSCDIKSKFSEEVPRSWRDVLENWNV